MASLLETIKAAAAYGKKAGYTTEPIAGGNIHTKALDNPKAVGIAYSAFHKKMTTMGYKVADGSAYSTDDHYNASYEHSDHPTVHMTCTTDNRAKNVKDGIAFTTSN